jgi:hypothetical protein
MARMKRPVWIFAGVLVLAGLVAYLALRPVSEHVVVNFIDAFDEAVERRPVGDDTFTVGEATLAGVTKRAIRAKNPSRIAWTVTIPDNAWLVVSAGIAEEAWTVAGDGVAFRISLNDDEVLNMLVDAYSDPSVRRWNDYEVDLSEFAGETMNVFLKTFASPPGANNTDGDLPIWGEPRIVTR